MMPYVITIFLILLGVLFKKSKFVFLIQLLWLWVLLGFNTGGADFNGYEQMYKLFGSSDISFGTDFLYRLSCHFFYQSGFTHVNYNVIMSLIGLLLISSTILKYSKKPSFVLSLFYIFPLVDAVIQKRNFISFAIIIYAVRYLFDKKSNFKYIIFCVLATGFHSSSIIYILLLFVNYFKSLKLKKKALFILIFSFIAMEFYPMVASRLFSSSRVSLYFEDMSFRMSIFKSILFCIMHFIFVKLFNQFYDKNIEEGKNKKFQDFVYKTNYLSLALLPLYFYNSTFFRIFRNLFILNYILISNKKSTDYTKLITVITVIYLIIISLLLYCITGDYGFNGLVKPIFEQNEIIRILFGG